MSTYSWKARLRRPVFLWATGAWLAEFAIQSCIKYGWVSPLPRLILILPLIPAIFFVFALGQCVFKLDELQKRISIESGFASFLLTVLTTFLFAGLDRLGIYHATFYDVGSLLLLFWGGAYIVVSRTYR